MKLLDGIKQKGKPFVIPDSSRNDLPQLFVDMGYEVGAEIGVYKGEFTKKLCKAGLEMYAVDPWMGFAGQGRTQQVQSTQDGYYEDAKKALTPFEKCTIIRKTSMEALTCFKDRSLDFVYIDGDHNFRHAASDIYEWAKKVKIGGIVAGHDYFCTPPFARNVVCQVKPVVDAYVKTFEIKNFYLCGGIDGVKRGDPDQYHSWFFIRQ